MAIRGGPGRPKGQKKTGGRTKGTPNAATVALAAAAMIQAQPGAQLPLEYLIELMRSPETKEEIRVHAARALLPYLHKRLPIAAEIDVTGMEKMVQLLEAVYGR
jgi:hypothetical protein